MLECLLPSCRHSVGAAAVPSALLYSACMPSPQNSGSLPHQPVDEQHLPRPWLPVQVIWTPGPHILEALFPSFRHVAGFSCVPSAVIPGAVQTLFPWLYSFCMSSLQYVESLPQYPVIEQHSPLAVPRPLPVHV